MECHNFSQEILCHILKTVIFTLVFDMDATKETAKAVVERVQRERQKQSFGFAWDKQKVTLKTKNLINMLYA